MKNILFDYSIIFEGCCIRTGNGFESYDEAYDEAYIEIVDICKEWEDVTYSDFEIAIEEYIDGWLE